MTPEATTGVAVTLAQVEAGTDRKRNRAALEDVFRRARQDGAALVVLPEYASAFDPAGVGAEQAEDPEGPFVTELRRLCATSGIAALAGTLEPGRTSDRAANVVVAVDAAGEVTGRYQKVHLYDAFGHRESDRLEPGPVDAPPLVVEAGGLRWGVMTCYDLRFPEMARRLVDEGAEALVVPAAWAAGPRKADQWAALLTARAIENTAAVVGVGLAGRGVTGTSLALLPTGETLLRLGEAPEVSTVRIDPDAVRRAREVDPSLTNRRYRVVAR